MLAALVDLIASTAIGCTLLLVTADQSAVWIEQI